MQLSYQCSRGPGAGVREQEKTQHMENMGLQIGIYSINSCVFS